MELFGKPSLNPWLFYSGKVSGYIVWIGFFFYAWQDYQYAGFDFRLRDVIAISFFITGLVIFMVSLFHLGRSVRFGLPNQLTVFKTQGIYGYSRNPMYVAFALFTHASILYTMNIVIILVGLYSLLVYHLIILSEEDFLRTRFGKNYEHYLKNVRRYF